MLPQVQGSEPESAALRNAHSSFRSVARQRLKCLEASGLQAEAASSRLLDDLIITTQLLSHQEKGGSGNGDVSCSGNNGGNSVSASTGGDGSSGGGSSNGGLSTEMEYVVARTGVNAAQASKIILLKEEISRLRCEGLSTVSVIERLQARLHESGDRTATSEGILQVGGLLDASNAAPNKKPRVGEDTFTCQPPVTGAIESSLSNLGRHNVLPDFSCHNGLLAEVPSPKSCPPCPADGKRVREEVTSALQLKKLKLRTAAMES